MPNGSNMSDTFFIEETARAIQTKEDREEDWWV